VVASPEVKIKTAETGAKQTEGEAMKREVMTATTILAEEEEDQGWAATSNVAYLISGVFGRRLLAYTSKSILNSK
jgi:hypothetical protein